MIAGGDFPLDGLASMGPRLFSRGNPTPSAAGFHAIYISFNGAAAIQPRKFRSAAVVGRQLPPRFNGAAAIQPRKFRSAAVVGRQLPPRFNGAAAIQPRKCRVGLVGFHDHQVGFNGAAAIQPRKSELAAAFPFLQILLQWGRGYSAAEISQTSRPLYGPSMTWLQWGRGYSAAEMTIRVADHGSCYCRASMGPRLFSRGNL